MIVLKPDFYKVSTREALALCWSTDIDSDILETKDPLGLRAIDEDGVKAVICESRDMSADFLACFNDVAGLRDVILDREFYFQGTAEGGRPIEMDVELPEVPTWLTEKLEGFVRMGRIVLFGSDRKHFCPAYEFIGGNGISVADFDSRLPHLDPDKVLIEGLCIAGVEIFPGVFNDKSYKDLCDRVKAGEDVPSVVIPPGKVIAMKGDKDFSTGRMRKGQMLKGIPHRTPKLSAEDMAARVAISGYI